MRVCIHATVIRPTIAYATNLGLHGIATKSSFSYAELAQLSDST